MADADNGHTILVVEDDTDVRESIREVLEDAGYHVATAANGKEGLDRLECARPSLILLDLMMPRGNGWAFRIEQQRDPALAEIPVVIWSGIDDPEPVAQYLRAAAYLTKPLDAARLFEAVRRHCH